MITICYQSFRNPDPQTWIAVYWLIMLFVAINAVSKSFMLENRRRNLYLYTLANPVAIIIAKIIYNLLLQLFIGGISLLFYMVVMGNPIQSIGIFIIVLFLGSSGLSATLTLLSAISQKSEGNFILLPVLSFPVIIPLLLNLIRISNATLTEVTFNYLQKGFLMTGGIILMVFALSVILFPFVWRE